MQRALVTGGTKGVGEAVVEDGQLGNAFGWNDS